MVLKTASLPPDILNIIRDKGTEPSSSGEYDGWDQPGTYLCRQCGLALFRAQDKFHSGCGWPSFDEEIAGTVDRHPDPDGRRTEIVCHRCEAHLGHIFEGEGFTAKNIRHCVNSLSLDFVPNLNVKDTEEAVFSGGCFWGIEHLFKQLPGVLKTEVGYISGHKEAPSYEEICRGNTGHLEAIRILYDSNQTDYETITKYFFEIHDPTQKDGQGPDLGEQYLSAVFHYDNAQKKIAEKLMKILQDKGYDVATRLIAISPFWRAETYHQDYYVKTGKAPYCHRYIKRF